MKKSALFLLILAALICIFAFSISAATTDEYGTVETSESIDLSKMATDDDVYCVLFDGTEYHTYPSRYIVTSSTDLTLNFSYINQAFEKEYTTKSVIRIQVPAHVLTLTTVFAYGKSAVKEVSFPKDKSLTTINWGAFEKCTTLESFTIPNTVTTFKGQNNFAQATGLKYIYFEEPCQLTTLPLNMLQGCKALKELVMPTTITSVGANLLSGCHSLERVVLSPNLVNISNAFRDMIRGRDYDMYMMEIYMNVNYGIEAGDVNTLFTSDGSDMKRYVIFLTGTEAEARALLSRATSSPQLRRANLVAYDPTKTEASQYLGLDPYTTDKVGNNETVDTNRVIVYNYSSCDAFYGGAHINGESVKYDSFLSSGIHAIGCTREGCQFGEATTLAPIFKSFGYSKKSYGDTLSFTQGFGVNYEALEKYNSLVLENERILAYGVLAVSELRGYTQAFENGVASDGVKSVDYSSEKNKKFNLFEMKVGGIKEGEELSNGTLMTDAKVYLCAYIKVGEGYLYISNGAQNNTLFGAVSYHSLAMQ